MMDVHQIKEMTEDLDLEANVLVRMYQNQDDTLGAIRSMKDKVKKLGKKLNE